MAAIKTFTATEMQAAKLAGFRTSKPKKPKGKKTVAKQERYIARYNVWVDKLKVKAKAGKAKLDDKKKLDSLNTKVAAL